MNRCYIFGSMNVTKFNFIIDETDMVIAADSGLKNIEKLNISADYIVGDFDSLGFVPEGRNIIQHPVKKDETDLILAIDIGLKNGYKNFVVYGCLGGRADHTFASIQSGAYIAQNGGNALFVDEETCIAIIKNTSISFSNESKDIISVFSLSDKSNGVNIKGLLYELNNTELSNQYPLGVSNEFIGKDSIISVEEGTLCIMWNGNSICNFGGQNDN